MPIYKQTTEITKIDDVWANIDRDIVEVYFGDKNIFTVWSEYTGTLPITITADGNALLDYRIYGADDGVGVATENLFDENSPSIHGAIQSDGSISPNVDATTYDYISVEPSAAYRMKAFEYTAGYEHTARIAWYDENKDFLYRDYIMHGYETLAKTSPTNAKYCRISINNVLSKLLLIKGSVMPTSYIPYGYKLPMTVQSANLFDYTQTDFEKGYRSNQYLTKTGQEGTYGGYQISEYIAIHSETPYYLSDFFTDQLSYAALCFYDENYQYLSGISYGDNTSLGFVSPPLAKFIRFTFHYNVRTNTALFELHKIHVYIGENQLDEGEYVSYSDGKIYRTVSGTLTPTDPPVPFPEIPTIDGTTIIDYDGDPKPSQMYVKYRKQYS